MAREPTTFFVAGKPEPKGSMKCFCPRDCQGHGRAYIVPDNPARLRAWTSCVVLRAKHYVHPMITMPVAVSCVFRLKRPKSHYRTGRSTRHLLATKAPEYPGVKPDLDKLLRAIFDALVKAGALKDDNLVCDLGDSRKEYVNPGDELGEGVLIRLRALQTGGQADER